MNAGTQIAGTQNTAPLRIGLLGASRIAELALIKPATATGDRLVAVAARSPERARAFAEKFGVERVVADYGALLADPEVEVVYNPLANALHGPWNLAAVSAGKHVLSEKPFASNATEAAQVAEAARAAGVTVLEGFHYWFHPGFGRVKQLVADGTLGEVRHIEAVLEMPRPGADDPRWRLDLAGGAGMDLGCYAIHVQRSFAQWAGGAPRVVSAFADEHDGAPGVDDRLDVELEFPGGATGYARASMVEREYRFTVRVIGSRGSVYVHNLLRPDLDDRLTLRTPAGTTSEHVSHKSTYTYQLEAFAAHLRTGAPLGLGVDDAVANMVLLDDVYRAAGFSPRPTYQA
ncbi:MAG TPA: Gfo/Idh/MocA family oxidoreductase [Aldersonia sp.]